MSHSSSPSPEKAPTRRGFFGILTWLVSGLAALAVLVPFGAYLFGPLRKRRAVWIKLGAVGDFNVGETRLVTFVNPLGTSWDGMSANNGVYARHLGQNQFLVFAANCTHLNCPVSWFPQSGLFMCPCHGGVYYEDGEHASGPPPRGLYHCVWRVTDGNLEIEAPHLPTLHDTLKTPG